MSTLRRGAPGDLAALSGWSREASDKINDHESGQLDNVFEGTLRTSQTTSTFADARIKKYSLVIPIPQTSNAAGALSGLYASSVAQGEVVFTHASNAQADKTFWFLIFGGTPPQTRTAT